MQQKIHPQTPNLNSPNSNSYKMHKEQSETIDLEDRDPKNLNQHLQVSVLKSFFLILSNFS